MAELYSIATSTENKTIGEALAKAKLPASARNNKPQKEKKAGQIAPLPPGAQLPKKMTQPAVEAEFVKVRSRLAPQVPPTWRPPYGKNGVVTNLLSFVSIPVDGHLWAAVQSAYFLAKDTARLDSMVQLVNSYHVTPGSEQGLTNRIVSALSDVPDIEVAKVDTKGKLGNVYSKLTPEAQILVTDTLSTLVARQPHRFHVNLRSASGMPERKQKEDTLEHDTVLADKFLAACVSPDSIREYISNNPDHFILLLKNKTDLYLRADLLLKTRPYFVWPSFLNYLISAILEPVIKALLVFTDKGVDTPNAYGFSWARGGADKIVEWALGAKVGRPLYAVYGDNILVAYIDQEDDVNLASMDIAHLDFGVHSSGLPGIQAQIEKVYDDAGVPLPPLWKNVLRLWASMSVKAPFMAMGSLSYASVKHWLKSGGVGTTYINTLYVIAILNDYIKTAKGTPTLVDDTQFQEFLVKRGLRIKETLRSGPLKLDVAFSSHEDTRYPIGFLGMDIVWSAKFKHFVPVLPEAKLAVSIAYRKKRVLPSDMPAYDIARMSGLAFVGAWYYPPMFEAFQTHERSLRSSFSLEMSKPVVYDTHEHFDIPAHFYNSVPSIDRIIDVLTNPNAELGTVSGTVQPTQQQKNVLPVSWADTLDGDDFFTVDPVQNLNTKTVVGSISTRPKPQEIRNTPEMRHSNKYFPKMFLRPPNSVISAVKALEQVARETVVLPPPPPPPLPSLDSAELAKILAALPQPPPVLQGEEDVVPVLQTSTFNSSEISSEDEDFSVAIPLSVE